MSRNRSREHVRAQRAGRERDLNTCQICGTNEKVQGHHILDHQYSGAAHIDNIVSLCQRCHTEVHRGNIDIIKF